MPRKFSVTMMLVLALLGISYPLKQLWAPQCVGCGDPKKLQECSDAIHSERFVIDGNSNPESARRAVNALRNKMEDILAASDSITPRSRREDFQAFNTARDDFDSLAKLVEKEKDAGEWRVTDSADKILDLCDDALHPEDLDKN